ncbi:hypothetical protein C2S51_037446 [Perilla frutescens var. frutescens]|nr:hypothetical protein C2S51_037446 [Perilla frutescens var. frutescens]
MERGKLVVEMVGGKSTVRRCFSKYPLKFIVPNKVGSSQTDAVWIYTITYGGGIVSGDSIAFDVTVGDGCTAVLTTQSSTKVYKSIGSKCCEQVLEASIGRDAVLVVIPDPVTCFSTARYSQTQIFKLAAQSSSLLLVDWITSGRHQNQNQNRNGNGNQDQGEKWAFSHYKSSNRILLQGTDHPLFLDTILLEQESSDASISISERMKDYQAMAMILLWGPKLKTIQNQIEGDVKKLMSQQLRLPSMNSSKPGSLSKPSFVASCSTFGPKGMEVGLVVRVASMTTEAIYSFLQHELAAMEDLVGAPPYR